MSVTRAELDQYTEDMRAYRLRQAEWLGLGATEVFELEDKPEAASPDLVLGSPPNLVLSWRATADQSTQRGHTSPTLRSRGDSELDATVFSGEIYLDWRVQRDMAAAIGEKPELPGRIELERAFDIG